MKVQQADSGMLLHEAIKGYLMNIQIERQRPGVIVLKRHRLKRFETWCEKQGISYVSEITANLMRAYVLYMEETKVGEINPSAKHHFDKNLCPSTIKEAMSTIHAFFNWCVDEDILDTRKNPMLRIPKVKTPSFVIETLSTEQLSALIDACDTSSRFGYRDYTMVLVLADTGIRVSELCGLELTGVHENYLTVFGKGAKEREVGLGPTAAKALWKYLHQHRKPGNEYEQHVFLSRSGRKLCPNMIWRIIQELGEKAGIKGVRLSPHTLRHTFAKMWLANGGDVFKLSRIMGHTDIETTQEYLKDFQSTDARSEHVHLSPIEKLRLGKKKNTSSVVCYYRRFIYLQHM